MCYSLIWITYINFDSEIWTTRKNDSKKLDAFELWVQRKIPRVSWTERKTSKKKYAETEIKHFIRSHNKNAENGIFWTLDEGTSIVGEGYNAGNNCRSKEERKARMRLMDDIKSVTGLSANDLNQLAKDWKKWKLLVNNIVKKRKRTNV